MGNKNKKQEMVNEEVVLDFGVNTEEPVVEPAEEPVVEPAEEPVVEPAEEPVVEPAEEPAEEPVVEPAEEPVVEPAEEPEEEPEEDNIQSAVVARCSKLNVRKEANATAEVVCVIAAGTELTVDPDSSTDDFYKVYTSVKDILVEGYCVKKFIDIK